MYAIMKTKPSGKVLYRYSDGWYEVGQYSGKIVTAHPMPHIFPVIRETDKSYFIEDHRWHLRRVPKTGKNVYAWDSEKKALFNYLKRKVILTSWDGSIAYYATITSRLVLTTKARSVMKF